MNLAQVRVPHPYLLLAPCAIAACNYFDRGLFVRMVGGAGWRGVLYVCGGWMMVGVNFFMMMNFDYYHKHFTSLQKSHSFEIS